MVFLLSLNELSGQVFILNTTSIDSLVEGLKVLIDVGEGGLNALIHLCNVVLGGHKLDLDVGNTGVNSDQTSCLIVQDLCNLDMVRRNLEIDISTMSQDMIHEIGPCHWS